ncbi:MAG: flagellar motor switch protein FliM [bacterium]|nr:flagellar motor switch protein FliM [bacterium]
MDDGPTIGKKIKEYDFKHPDKFSKDQLRTIQLVHESFARLVSATLSTQLRAMVHTKVVSVNQITYGEFMQSVPNPSTLAIIDLDPLKGEGLVVMNQNVSFGIIERLLGGKGGETNLTRELSDIELTLIERIIDRILNNFKEAWASTIEIRPRISNIECNPQFTQVIPPGDMVILTVMDIGIGEIEGKLSFCLPGVSIEPFATKLSSQHKYIASSGRKELDEKSVRKVKKELSKITVPVIAELGVVNISLNDVMQLQIGDVVKLQMGINNDLILKVGGKAKYACRPGVVGSKLGVQITKVLNEGEILGEEGE